jgi:hypothetical protein
VPTRLASSQVAGQIGIGNPQPGAFPVSLCDASGVIAFYRLGLFLATLSFLAGVALLVASLRESGLGVALAVIILLGSMSLIRGLRRRVFTPDFAMDPHPQAYSRHSAGRHR